MDKPKSNPRFWYSHPADIEKVMGCIEEEDVVLDVGGASQPFSRADYVVDAAPYPDKNLISVKGWSPIRFSRETWLKVDLSSEPLPFEDKSMDYVFCSHTLSSVRDPIFLCREIIRVGKRGFLDFPSKWIECQHNVDAGNLSEYYAGYVTHRWLIEIRENHLIFTPKTQLTSVVSYEKKEKIEKFMNSPRIWSSSLFWEADFTFEEKSISSVKDVLDDLKDYFGILDCLSCAEELENIRLAGNLNGERHDKMLVQAWQHQKNGRYNLAINLLRDILRERPDKVDAQALLGLCAASAGTLNKPEKPECREMESAFV